MESTRKPRLASPKLPTEPGPGRTKQQCRQVPAHTSRDDRQLHPRTTVFLSWPRRGHGHHGQ